MLWQETEKGKDSCYEDSQELIGKYAVMGDGKEPVR